MRYAYQDNTEVISTALPQFLVHDPEFGVRPAATEWTGGSSDPQLDTHPFIVPHLIVDITDTADKKWKALHQHRTQIHLVGDDYRKKIPMLARLRGIQIGSGMGEGFRQVVIRGVTTDKNRLAQNLPNGTVHEVHKLAEAA